MKPRRVPPALFAVMLLCGGCALTPAPLKTDHGYPADWPRTIALGKGLTELNGIYVNQGVAKTGDGKLVPIALADLVPRTMPRKDGSAEPDSGCEDCVVLRVLPPTGEFLSGPTLRFTLPVSFDPRVFDVPVSGNADATLYVLQNFAQSVIVGVGVGATNVTLAVSNFQPVQAGSYRVRVSNPLGVVKSEYADLVPASPPRLASCVATGTEGATLRIQGAPYQMYVVECSTDLSHWTPLATNLMATNLWEYLDRSATNFSRRFYRAVVR